jgi:excisionase family DNA binding protein
VSRKTNEETLEMMLTIRQVADFLHISISTVRRWSDSGMLRSYRIGPRGDRRYLRDDVLRLLEESACHPQAGAAEKKIANWTQQG